VSRKILLPVVVEVVGVEFILAILVSSGTPVDKATPAVVEEPGPPEVRCVAPIPEKALAKYTAGLFR